MLRCRHGLLPRHWTDNKCFPTSSQSACRCQRSRTTEPSEIRGSSHLRTIKKGLFARSARFHIKSPFQKFLSGFSSQQGASFSRLQLTVISPIEIRNLCENKPTEATAGEGKHEREITQNEPARFGPPAVSRRLKSDMRARKRV